MGQIPPVAFVLLLLLVVGLFVILNSPAEGEEDEVPSRRWPKKRVYRMRPPKDEG